jgi:hypothetical protein
MYPTRVKLRGDRHTPGHSKFFVLELKWDFTEVVKHMNISCQVSDRIPCARDGTIYSALDEFRPDDVIYLNPKDSPPPSPPKEIDVEDLLSTVHLATQPERKDTIPADPREYS